MTIVLIVAVLVVAVAVLYMTVTLSTRIRQSTAPQIDDAVKGVSGQIDTAAQDLRRQIADDLQQDREQQRLDGRQIQGRLDHADTRASSMANQILAELDTIRRLVEQLGARQDQFAADLGKLDRQVARLGEPPTRTGARPYAAAPEKTPAGGPAIVPGRLYAERLRFSIAAVQPESYSPRSERQYRIQVERQVGALPSPQPGAVNDPSTIIHHAEHDAGYRKRLSEAAAGYFATKLGDPVFAVVTEAWITQHAYPETALVEVCNRISSGLDTIAGKPLGNLRTELRLPGPEAAAAAGAGAGAGVGGALVLQPVTEPLGQAVAFLEITGAVVGTATGLRPLALAAVKMLAHDQFYDFVARRLREAARQVFEGPGGSAHAQPLLRPVAEAPAPDRTHPQMNPPQRAEVRPSDPTDPDWDDRPDPGGPGAG